MAQHVEPGVLHGASEPATALLEVESGREDQVVRWGVDLDGVDGALLSVEPRFRGRDVLEPWSVETQDYDITAWDLVGETEVHFSTQTCGNPR